VALKILRADCYGGSHDIFEREILSRLSDISRKSDHGGRHHVLPLLDQFKHEGPNGQHVCFVFDVLGHHLDFQTAKYEDGRLPLKAVKIIARQLLLGLDFLHRECGIIHTGIAMRCESPLTHYNSANYGRHIDLKPTNILLELETPEETIEKYLSEIPARVSHERGVTKPLREVIRTPLISEMLEPRIRIVDFGVGTYRASSRFFG
jgi:serine/threonine-protein kinase SRPK3